MCLGIPGRIISVRSDASQLGLVDVAGVRREVNLACVAPDEGPLDALVGAWVLVHVGFALSRIDPDEAERTLALLRELGEAQDAVTAPRAEAAP